MNWRSVKYLSEDDYGKPLLLNFCNLKPRYYDYEVGFYVNKTINCHSAAWLTDKLPDNVYYIRIDEIL